LGLGLGCRIWGVGLGLAFRVQCSGLSVECLGCGVWGLGVGFGVCVEG
jgi:hypothetical protein